ncbi:MAG: hypothetical protein IJG82_09575 [Atopobiaceae bacterium]|nr:hypothetical protein [Atopobiaceae bacterium]
MTRIIITADVELELANEREVRQLDATIMALESELADALDWERESADAESRGDFLVCFGTLPRPSWAIKAELAEVRGRASLL